MSSPTASSDKRSAPSVATTKWSGGCSRSGSRTDRSGAERDRETVAGLARILLGHNASISCSRATGRPRRAARILRRSRAFFDFHASGGIGWPCRRTRKPPSVWSASGAGPSEAAAINTPDPRPAVSRKPSFRSSRSRRSASSLAPESRAARARLVRSRPVRRARAAARAPPRGGRHPAPRSRTPATRATRRRQACPAACRVLGGFGGKRRRAFDLSSSQGDPAGRERCPGARSRSVRPPRLRARRLDRGRRP